MLHELGGDDVVGSGRPVVVHAADGLEDLGEREQAGGYPVVGRW